MCANSIYAVLKVIPIQVLWGQSIYHLGTQTLKVKVFPFLRVPLRVS